MDIFNYRGVHNNLNRLPGQTHTGWTSMSGKHMAAVAGNVIIGRAGKIEKIWNKYDNGQLKALSDRKVSTEALDPYRPDAKLGQRERPADEGGSKSFSEPAIDAKPLAVAIPERVPADKRAAVNAIANRVATEFAGMQKIGQQKLNYQLRELRSEIFELAHDAIENPESLSRKELFDQIEQILNWGFNSVDQKETNWTLGSKASDWRFTNELAKAYDSLLKERAAGDARD